MYFVYFWLLPEKLSDCPKIVVPDSRGTAAPPPARTPMQVIDVLVKKVSHAVFHIE